jgi:plant 4alpha-monomethylsterol monooxygenase
MAGIPIVERAWSALLDNTTHFHLKTTVTFAIHELSYWAAFLPFLLCDQFPSLHRYKLQPDKQATRETFLNCLRRLVLSHFCLVLPMIFATHPVLDLMGSPHSLETLPPLSTTFAQITFFFLLEDFLFYFGHRALHTPTLYKKIHSVHHEHSAPFGIVAEYAHPLEVLFLGAATILPPMLVGPHLFTLFLYLSLRCFQTVECHSGYDLPFSPNKWIPLYGGARFHDFHHKMHSHNYASTFIWVDWLAGTDKAFRTWELKQAHKAIRAEAVAE